MVAKSGNSVAYTAVVGPTPAPRALPGMHTFVAGHPVPTEGSFAAGRAILGLLAACDERTLVFFLLSGGGSALVEQRLDVRMTLEDFQALNRVLVTCESSSRRSSSTICPIALMLSATRSPMCP